VAADVMNQTPQRTASLQLRSGIAWGGKIANHNSRGKNCVQHLSHY